MAMMGIWELIILTMFNGGMGIPLGMPPEKEDILMARIAPRECLFYTTWSGAAKPDPSSENHTERLLAEKEVQFMLSQIESKVKEALDKWAEGEGEEGKLAAEIAPKWGKLLLTRPACIYISKFEVKEDGPSVRGGAAIRVDQQGDEIKAILEKLQADLGDAVKSVEIDGGTYHQIHPGPGAPSITWGIRGPYLVAGVGDNGLEELFDNALTPAPKWLTDMRDEMAVDRVSTVTYANVGKILEMAVPLAGDPTVGEILKATGLDDVTSYASVTGLDKKGFVNLTSLGIDGEPKGLLKALVGKPLAAADLKRIPHDSPVAVALRFDGGAFFDAFLEVVGKVEPFALDEIKAGMAETEDVIGVNIREELIGSLGDTWYVYSAPTEGSLVTGWTGVVSVRDRMTLEQVHEALLAVMKASFGDEPRAPRIKQLEFEGQVIHFLDVPDDDMPFTPAWCLTQKELIFGLFPQAVKGHVARKGKSLIDQPAVSAHLKAEDGTLALTYCDTNELFQLAYPMVQMGLTMAFNEIFEGEIDLDVSILPSVGSISKHLQPGISVVKRTENGIGVESYQTLPGGSVGSSVPVVVALMLPAVQSARIAAQRAEGSNNLRQLALGVHNYADTMKGIPTAYSIDKEGKPLLSWRVHLLPFLGEEALYDKFKLDEPWDSEHNKKLIPLMPDFLRSAASKAEPGMTTYLAIRGAGAMIVPPEDKMKGITRPTGIRLGEVTDGLSNTIMIVEGNDAIAVPWTKPDDYEYDKDAPTKGLLGLYGPGFQAAIGDGSVHFFHESTAAETVLRLFDRKDGKPVDAFGFDRPDFDFKDAAPDVRIEPLDPKELDLPELAPPPDLPKDGV